MEVTIAQFESDASTDEVKSPRKWRVFSKKFKAKIFSDRRDADTYRECDDDDDLCRDSPSHEEQKNVTAEEQEITLLNDKGNEFFVRGEFVGALRMYSEALKVLKTPVQMESEVRIMDEGMKRFHTARLLVNIGAVQIRQNLYADAISSLELAIRSAKLVTEKSVHYYRSLEVLSDALENLGLAYYKQKDFDRSFVMYNEALDARRACLELVEQKWKGRIMKSKEEVRKIKDERFACKMELASTLHHVALLEERQGNIKKAIERCDEALAVRKAVYEDYTADESSLALLTALGRLYSHRSVGWYKEALNHFEKVYELKSKLHDGGDHLDIVPSINNIAYVQGEIGEYKQCLALSNRAIDICTTGRGLSKETVAAYTNKGYALYNIGDNQGALSAYSTAMEFLSKCGGDDDLIGADLHQRMSDVYMDMGSFDNAITSLEHLIEMKKEVLGGESKELALPYKKLGKCYEMSRNYSTSIKCHTRALRIYKHHNDKEGAAKQHNKIAGILKKKGDMAESMDHYMAALWHSREAKLPSTDPTVADTIQNVAAFQNSNMKR